MYRVVTSTLHSFLSPFLWPLVFLVFFSLSFFLLFLRVLFSFEVIGWKEEETVEESWKVTMVQKRDEQLVKINGERREEHSSYDAYILTGIQILLPTDEPILLREFYKPLKNHTKKNRNYFFSIEHLLIGNPWIKRISTNVFLGCRKRTARCSIAMRPMKFS